MSATEAVKLGVLTAHLAAMGAIALRGWWIARARGRAWAARFARTAAATLVVVLAIEGGAYAYVRFIEPNWIVVERLRLEDTVLAPRLADTRIVQLADLHIERVGFRERAMVRQVNHLQPAWIAITGDLVNTRDGWDAAVETIARLRATNGIVVVPGNTDNYAVPAPQFDRDLSAIGARVLRNASLPIGASGAWFVGVDDPVNGVDRLELALRGAAGLWGEPVRADGGAAPPVILLAHSSDVLPEAQQAGVPLVLVGHTHGGQLGIAWLRRWSRYTDRGPHVGGGLYRLGATQLYVNRGIGTKTRPYRFLAPPEVTLVEFGAANG